MKVLMFKTDTVEDVKDSYALNYLIPNGLAVRASQDVIRRKQEKDAKRDADMKNKRMNEKAEADRLFGTTVRILSKANDDGELFGSVTKAQVKKALDTKLKVEVVLKKPIKTTGDHEVVIALGKYRSQITVSVQDS